MPSSDRSRLAIKVPDIEGLQQSLDSRKVNKPHVTAGRNYLHDADGPKSGFGGVYLTEEQFYDPAYHQTIEVESEVWHFCQRCIMRFNPYSLQYDILYVHANTANRPYRWTSALVNDKIFFAHPAVGLLYWDTDLKRVYKVTSVWLPASIVAVSSAYGRLVVLGKKRILWSAQDDGLDLAPSLQTGAGTQLLSIIGGEGVMLAPYQGGVLAFTTSRILRSELTADIVVFRHRPVRVGEERTRLLNSFCVQVLDNDEVLFLDETGLYTTRGDTPKEWQPLFNVFLRKELKHVQKRNGYAARLQVDGNNKRVYLSLAYDSARPIYQRAYVLDVPTERFGIFNEPHYSIAYAGSRLNKHVGFHWGAVKSDRRFFLWDEDLEHRESSSVATDVNLFKPPLRQYTYTSGDAIVFPDAMRIRSGIDEYALGLAGKNLGMYDVTGEFVVEPPQIGLDSYIKVGLLRWDESRYDDELSLITDLSVGNAETGDDTLEAIDMEELADADVDMEALAEVDVDMGESLFDVISYGVLVESSYDSKTTVNSSVGELKKATPLTNFYGVYTLGIYHRVTISADEVGEYFHIKNLELSGTPAGRL